MDLDQVVKSLGPQTHPDLLVGLGTSDDAGVYRIDADTALVQTLDFFTPVVDSPYDFGRIAAANALSDVYAMGGVAKTAMNIVCFPCGEFPNSVLESILAGGLAKIHEAGALLVGGHSVDDQELKYGLSVTGIVHPDRFYANSGARTGDRIILTKPLGTGVIATAVKGRLAEDDTIALFTETMAMLNKTAASVMARFNVSACTDVTGFGLCGHLMEMAAAGGKQIEVIAADVPLLENALSFAEMGLVPAGCYANRKFFEPRVTIDDSLHVPLVDLLFDPQTSGGLMLSVAPEQAADCVAAMRDEGVDAAMIGTVTGDSAEGWVGVR